MGRPDDNLNILCSSVVGKVPLDSFTMRKWVQIPVIEFYFVWQLVQSEYCFKFSVIYFANNRYYINLKVINRRHKFFTQYKVPRAIELADALVGSQTALQRQHGMLKSETYAFVIIDNQLYVTQVVLPKSSSVRFFEDFREPGTGPHQEKRFPMVACTCHTLPLIGCGGACTRELYPCSTL